MGNKIKAVMIKNNKTVFVTVTVVMIMTMMAMSSFSLANTLHDIQVFAQTNNTNSTISNVNITSATTSSPNSPIVSTIDKAISSIKSGNNDGGKKQLLSAEQQLEGKPNVSDAEKHIEGSLQALKEGDNKGAISHAQFAKDMLNK
jgi:hypothetical protein